MSLHFVKRISIFLSFVFYFYPVFGKSVEQVVKHMDAFVDKARGRDPVPGIAFALATPSKLLLLKVRGVKKRGEVNKINAHTVFRIASLSKGFTGALAVKLAQEGYLSLEDSIEPYIAPVVVGNPSLTSTIRIKDILAHASGVPQKYMEDRAYQRIPLDHLLKGLRAAKAEADPGQVFQYQNVIFSLMRPVTEAAYGAPFEEALRANLLLPLKMQDTLLTEKEYKACKNLALPHIFSKNKYEPGKSSSYYYNILPAGGISASIHDMVIWLQALMGNTPSVLNEEALNTLFSPLVSIECPKRKRYVWKERLPSSSHYGLGWHTYNYDRNTVIYHGGAVSGFRAVMAFSKLHKIGIVILINADTKLPEIILSEFLRYLFEEADE